MELHYNPTKKEIVINSYRLDKNTFSSDLTSSKKSYNLGDLLTKYLNLDKTIVNEIKNNYFHLDIPCSSKEVESNVKKIFIGFNKLVQIHPYYESIYPGLIDCVDSYRDNYNNRYYYIKGTVFKKQNLEVAYNNDNILLNRIFEKMSYCEELKKAIDFCFIDSKFEEFNDLSPINRFKIYDLMDMFFFSGKIFSNTYELISKDAMEEFNDLGMYDIHNKEYRERLLKFINTTNEEIIHSYQVDFESALLLELFLLLSSEMNIKKCLNCNQYFVPKNRDDEKYCSNIFKNNKTCKELGWNYIDKSIEYTEYRKKYRAFFNFKKNNEDKFDELGYPITLNIIFIKWSEIAELKREYISSLENTSDEYKNSLDSFLNWLDISYKAIKRITNDKATFEESSYLANITKGKMIQLSHWLESLGE